MPAPAPASAAELVSAGGYLVQFLPEGRRGPLAVMTERLDADFSMPTSIDALVERDPDALAAEILYGMAFEKTQEAELSYGCHCSSVRVLSSLSTLPKAEIRELLTSKAPLHITCDYCGTAYELSPTALAGLLSPS